MAGNVAEAFVQIEGTRPLLWHAFTSDTIPLERQEKAGVPGNNPDEWQKTVLYHPDTRQLYIPGTYVFACIREGSKYTRKGRGSYQAMIVATLLVQEEIIFIDDRYLPDSLSADANEAVYLDVRGVRNPATKGVNVRYRVACRSGWTCSFHLAWDKSLVGKDVLGAVLLDAGRFVGIGNGRNIGMGRFQINALEF